MDFSSLGLQGKRVLLVASTGGHLAEIGRIASQLGLGAGSSLVTFDSPQSAKIDWVDDVFYVPYLSPRDVRGTLRATSFFRKLMRDQQWDAVVSTGAAIAVAALPVASAAGVRSVYIESYARFDGPSTTGRLLRRSPFKIELYTQHQQWASRLWHYTGSVLDTVERAEVQTKLGTATRWFITLGTISPFRFDSLIESVLSAVPRDADIVWQLGCTDRAGLPGRVYSHLDAAAFAAEANAADVVISHAGVGTAIDLIEMGHRPIIVPRRAHRGEHVDDHQLQIARDLASRGYVRSCESDDLRLLLSNEGLAVLT